MKKNFIDFGIIESGKKKIYQTLSGNLYDTYMVGRYFNDIYNLEKLIKNEITFKKNLIHDTKDLKFNLINFLLLLRSKKNLFYEFGFTLYEKISFFRLFNTLSTKKIILNKIKFHGMEISDLMIFFVENFYKNFKIDVNKTVKKKFFSKSVFFSKGVTLLYEKKNMLFLSDFINECESGSFDISLYPKKKIKNFPSGYTLHYPSVSEFIDLLKKSNKSLFFRNKKKIGKKIYLEIIFGEKNLDKKINSDLLFFSKNKKCQLFKKYLSINKKFKELKVNNLR